MLSNHRLLIVRTAMPHWNSTQKKSQPGNSPARSAEQSSPMRLFSWQALRKSGCDDTRVKKFASAFLCTNNEGGEANVEKLVLFQLIFPKNQERTCSLCLVKVSE